jgi:hypothetical protein
MCQAVHVRTCIGSTVHTAGKKLNGDSETFSFASGPFRAELNRMNAIEQFETHGSNHQLVGGPS